MIEKIHLVYCSDAGYLEPTVVSAASALFHAKEHPLVIHLIETGLTDDQWLWFVSILKRISPDVEVMRHTWTNTCFDMCPAWHGSRIIYARLMIQDIITADWAISVDGDTLWLGDPWAMLSCRNDAMAYQMSYDPPDPRGLPNENLEWYKKNGLQFDPKMYFCVGATLMNLKRLRAGSYSSRAVKLLSHCPDPQYPEQMVMCYLAQGEECELPRQWGCYSMYHTQINIHDPCLIHYVQDPPWRRTKPIQLLSDIVLLWHRYATRALGRDTLAKIPVLQRVWRRGIYLCFKTNQWLLSVLPKRLRMLLQNTKGI